MSKEEAEQPSKIPESCGVEAHGHCEGCELEDTDFWCLDGKLVCLDCKHPAQWCPECCDGPSIRIPSE